ncbi:ligase-associated DNA damage response exonuclease [Lysobacter enzymogenes]|uniref:ligase-associated DNA damage response exonuclease n=1 Tax=Lysobacter enzymogenes TaxID=69 RepID=UPI00384EED20
MSANERPDDLVVVRPEGLYCPPGDFYIDPWRPVARAVVTHGHGDHARPDMGEYHTSAAGLPILRWRLGERRYNAYDYGAPFRLGAATVSLHPAGHVLGSAQVRIEARGRVWVVSGDYKRQSDPTCAAFEPVACDTFVTEATFALPIYRWPDTRDEVAQIAQWRERCAERGEAAVLCCYALGKAQRVLAELRAVDDRPVWTHGAIEAGVQVYREAGVAMVDTRPVAEQPAPGRSSAAAARDAFAGELVLAPPSALGSAWMRRFRDAQTGFASGWMRVRGNRRRRNVDRGFVISDHADWPALLASIRATGAQRVLATHGRADALVRVLREDGIDAAALATGFEGEGA